MRKADTKERILSEALKLFAQKGYEAVGVIEIAEAVGIKAPSLYNHYKNKRAIFDSIIERVNEMDLKRAKNYEMPEGTMEEVAESYKSISIEKISAYTKAVFLHWTEEEFSSCFRKLLTIEQYKTPEMSQLYQKYISGEPIKYMAGIFGAITNSESESLQWALEFYGPIYLLYNIYDGTSDIDSVMKLLENHIENFSRRLTAERKEGDQK